eukprot:3205498-Rhodomonas_salina.1
MRCPVLTDAMLPVGHVPSHPDMSGMGQTQVTSPMCLRACYAMSGTDLANDVSATRCPVLTCDLRAYQPTRCAVLTWVRRYQAMVMFEEEKSAVLELAGIGLRACYVMPGTDVASGSTSSRMSLRAMRCPVLTHTRMG